MILRIFEILGGLCALGLLAVGALYVVAKYGNREFYRPRGGLPGGPKGRTQKIAVAPGALYQKEKPQ